MIQVLDSQLNGVQYSLDRCLGISSDNSSSASFGNELIKDLGWSVGDRIVFGQELPNWYIGRTNNSYGFKLQESFDLREKRPWFFLKAHIVIGELLRYNSCRPIDGIHYYELVETKIQVPNTPYFWYHIKPANLQRYGLS
jgi:hypothetical protein